MFIKKNGKKRNKQSYKCKVCGKQFYEKPDINSDEIITKYIEGKQTLSQLSKQYDASIKTIWTRLGKMRHIHKISKDKDVVILIDTTYWGRNFGLMVIKDAYRNKILWFKFVKNETVPDYAEGVQWLKINGFKIYGIVCDGMRGLFREFRCYRVQMCQFHMEMIVRRYLTNSPDLEASRELLELSRRLPFTTREEFTCSLSVWYSKWEKFINERSIERKTGKTHYTHDRLRSAYLSLQYYLPYLWTYQSVVGFSIPNTNAGIESLFGRIKTLLRVHSGISRERRIKLIKEIIARYY